MSNPPLPLAMNGIPLESGDDFHARTPGWRPCFSVYLIDDHGHGIYSIDGESVGWFDLIGSLKEGFVDVHFSDRCPAAR